MKKINEKLLNQWIGKTETIEDVITLAPARVIAMLEQFSGVGYIAIVVSRLIGLTINKQNKKRR